MGDSSIVKDNAGDGLNRISKPQERKRFMLGGEPDPKRRITMKDDGDRSGEAGSRGTW